MGKRGQNAGSVYRRAGSKTWTAALTLPDGKRTTRQFPTRGEAERWASRASSEIEIAATPGHPGRTLGMWLDEWLDYKQGHIRESTLVRYRQLVGVHVRPVLGEVSVVALTSEHVRRLQRAMLAGHDGARGVSAATANRAQTMLHAALEDALASEHVSRNVAALVKPLREVRSEPRTLTLEEARRFIAAIKGDVHECLYLLALTTGIRQSELFGLQWSDIDLGRGTLTVRRKLRRYTGQGIRSEAPKSRATLATRPLLRPVVDALRAHKIASTSDWLFVTSRGTPLDGKNFRAQRWGPLLERLGLPAIKFHELRHSNATLYAALGIHPTIVARLLGHASTQPTLRFYTHSSDDAERAAVAALENALYGAGGDTATMQQPSVAGRGLRVVGGAEWESLPEETGADAGT